MARLLDCGHDQPSFLERLQVLLQCGGGGIPVRSLRVKAPAEDRAQGGRARVRERSPETSAEVVFQVRRSAAVEGEASGEHGGEEDSHRPEVRKAIDDPRIEPFRRDIGQAAKRLVGERTGDRQLASDAEVEDAQAVCRLQPEVLWLDVTMDDALDQAASDRPTEAMKLIEKLAELDRNADSPGLWEGAAVD